MTTLRAYFLLAVLLFAFQNTGAQQLPGENDRIGWSADGNLADEDDWAATSMALAIFAKMKWQEKLVHFDYNNRLDRSHEWKEAENYESTMGGARRFGFNEEVFFDDQRELEAAIKNATEEINKSHEGSKFWYVQAGPFEVAYQALLRADPGKRQYCILVSHSEVNEVPDKWKLADGSPSHGKDDCVALGAGYFFTTNQYMEKFGGKRYKRWDLVDWMKNSPCEEYRWVHSRFLATAEHKEGGLDASDGGMAFVLATGDLDGNFSPKLRDFLGTGWWEAPPGWKSSGIADIDETRKEVIKTPTTTQNAIPRRATLYRWWRFLMHQGYDLSAFDETADILLQETADLVMDQEFSTPKARQAISDGFAVLEDIYASNLYIQEVMGSGSATQAASRVARSPTDWPFYHGTDGGQTGYSPDPGPSKGEIAWRFPKGSNFSAKPVFENGKVYFSSPGIDVIAYCLDEISGEILWNGRQYKTRCYENGGVSRVDPVLTSEGVLIKSEDSFLFDKDSGKLLWKGKQEDLEERLTEKPVPADQMVYTASIKGEMIALNNASGDTVWTTDTGESLDGPVSVGKGRIYAGSRDAKLLCLDPSDGSVMWTFQSPDKETRSKQYFSAATEANGRVYVGSAGKHLYSLDATSGKLVWKYMLSDWIRSRPIVVGNTVFAATLDGEMIAMRADGNKGRKKWAADLCAHGVAEDLVGNSNGILACGRDGIWYSVSPESGEIQWKHGVIDGAFVGGKYVTADWGGVGGIPTPSVVDGVVYIGGGDGFVNALDVETGKEIWRFETKASTHTLTVAADKVFFGILGSSEPKYYALDRRTGELVWESSSFGNRVWVGASYVDGRLVFGTTDGIMYGADALTGEKIWEYNIEQDIAKKDRSVPGLGIYSNPAFDDKYVYMGSWIGYYMAFDALTGKMKWKCRTFDHRRSDGRPDSSAPVLWKGHLYVQKLAEYIAAINSSTGEIEWQWKAPYGWVQNGTVAAFNDKIFGSAARLAVILPYGVRIYAFNDLENGGDLLWEYEGGGGWTAPVGTDDKLIFGSNGDAFMTCLDPEDGSLKWRVYTGDIMRENVPAIYGNKVIAHFMNGWVLAIE